jgi:hypothetical protein
VGGAFSIGSLNEKPLHAALKQWYAQPGDQLEARVDGYVIDILRGSQLLEVQTGNFAAIKTKINKLVATHPLRLILPIAREKWIIKPAGTGHSTKTRRKSPRKGVVQDLFWELVSFPQLINHPNFSLEVVFVKEEEVWHKDGKRHFRRKGWAVAEHHLVEVLERRSFERPADWLALLPDVMEESFTTLELAQACGIRRKLAEKMLYCLRKAEIIAPAGKRGRAYLYKVTQRQLP